MLELYQHIHPAPPGSLQTGAAPPSHNLPCPQGAPQAHRQQTNRTWTNHRQAAG